MVLNAGKVVELSNNKKYGWVFVGQAVVSAGNFLSTVILARGLGIDDFGVFSISWILMMISSSVIMGVCIFPMMSQYDKENDENKERYLQGVFWLVVLVSSVSSILFVVLFSAFSSDFTTKEFFVIAAMMIALNCQEFTRRFYITKNEPEFAFLSDSLFHGIRLTALLSLLFLSELSVFNSLVVFLVSSAIGCIPTVKAMPRIKFPVDAIAYSWGKNKSYAQWLLPSAILQWTSINLFISMAAYLISPAALGIIRACQSLMAIMNVPIQIAENIVPRLASSKLMSGGDHLMWKLLIKISLVGVLPFMFVAFLVKIFGGEVMAHLYGNEYGGSVVHVSVFIYSLAYILVFLVVPLRAGFRALDKTKLWFYSYVFSTLFSLCSVYYLETEFGVKGAVLGILLAHIVLISVGIALALNNQEGKSIA